MSHDLQILFSPAGAGRRSVLDGGPAGRSLGRFCGEATPEQEIMTSNPAWIKLCHADCSNNGRGFKIAYNVGELFSYSYFSGACLPLEVT